MALITNNAITVLGNNSPQQGLGAGIIVTTLLNPLSILTLKKQVFDGSAPKSYGQLAREASNGNPMRLFTLGLFPTIGRNLFLATALIPPAMGYNYAPLTLTYALGAIILSHPFEVARVLIQH